MDEPAVLQTLATLPSKLNETYDRILRNIPRARVPNAIKILQLLAFAKRPLLFKEIIDALATDPDSEPPFDPENRIVPPDAIAGYCSSLLRITAGNGGGPEMQLAHFSVQEYLLLDRLGNPYNGFFREVAASAAITQILLAYLWTAAAVAQETVDSTTKLSDFPLARFAAQNWLDFARRSGEDQDDTFAWTSRIFMQDSFMRYWLSFYDPGVDGMGNDAKAPALYYAALGGLHRSVRSLLDGGANPNAQGGRYGNALQATSLHGNVQTAKILVEYGADINAQAGLYDNALKAALHSGNVEMVGFLLEHGADADAGFGDMGLSLSAAALQGHIEIVKLLLDSGADVNAANSGHDNALIAACSRGNLEVVELLLQYGADVNAHGRDSHALTIACSQGDVKLALRLLDCGADIKAQNRSGRDALRAASEGGHIELVRLLLVRGSDINPIDSDQPSAIQLAASEGHVKIVQLLLEYGADPDWIHKGFMRASGHRSRNALQFAASAGHAEIVELLLDRGADINAEVGSTGSALQLATENGHSEIVKMLLHHGARQLDEIS